jgi:hypothetical protein
MPNPPRLPPPMPPLPPSAAGPIPGRRSSDGSSISGEQPASRTGARQQRQAGTPPVPGANGRPVHASSYPHQHSNIPPGEKVRHQHHRTDSIGLGSTPPPPKPDGSQRPPGSSGRAYLRTHQPTNFHGTPTGPVEVDRVRVGSPGGSTYNAKMANPPARGAPVTSELLSSLRQQSILPGEKKEGGAPVSPRSQSRPAPPSLRPQSQHPTGQSTHSTGSTHAPRDRRPASGSSSRPDSSSGHRSSGSSSDQRPPGSSSSSRPSSSGSGKLPKNHR